MTKKILNQNAKYAQELIDIIEPDFLFSSRPLDRFKTSVANNNINQGKSDQLKNLKVKINSIEDCKIKNNSKNLVMGDGDINSSIMLIGETPGELEDSSGYSFQGEIGFLLKKMLSAINIKIEKIY